MSLTVTQANQVNVLIAYVVGAERGGALVTSGEAKQAAIALAAAAHQKLHAGIRPEDVDKTWPDRA